MRTIQRSLVALLLLIAVTAQAQNHKLTLKSAVGPVLSITILMHDEYGYFDDFHEAYSLYAEGVPNTFDVAPGDSVKIHITRYEQSGWKYTYTEMDGVKVHEAKKDYSADLTPTDIFMLTMPDHDVTLTFYGEFDPDDPQWGLLPSPGGNSWNDATGELFINYFTGNWYEMMNYLGAPSASQWKILTFSGSHTQFKSIFESFGSSNFGPNVEKLDLRHTYDYYDDRGIWVDGTLLHENVYGLNLSGLPKLKQLILPSDIEYIGWWVFPVSSVLEGMTLYATVPPAIRISEYEYKNFMLYGFDRIPASCVLYVPEQSVAAYKADEVWGTHFADILPIPEGEAENITVDLPDNFRDGRYEGMSLMLFNARTGEQTKYIVDERPSYIFYAQTCNEPYTAQLQSAQGALIASTDTLTLGNQPMEMIFKSAKPMHTVQLTVMTPARTEGGEPTNVTDQTTIVWTDAMGNRIATGNTLDRQVEGTRLLYGISLPAELSAHYGVPPRNELVVSEATAQTTHILARPDTITLSGKVTDTEGNPVAVATVTAALMMNGTVGKTFTATTDQMGRYEVTTLAGDVTLSVTARGYETQRRECRTQGMPDLDFTLVPLSGPTIVYQFTFTETAAPGEEATTQPFYGDYANVAVAAYNETTGEVIDSLMVQYPEVQLLSGAKTGDSIRLTASSMKDGFMPVEATTTLHEESTDTVTFAIVQKGAIKASFERTNNQEVTAALYNADGLLIGTDIFDEATITLSELADGQYTLVMMGSDPLLSKMLNLDDYTALGMTEGKDYVMTDVTVKSGMTAVAAVEEVPLLNASPFYYTDDTKTLFMPNKTEVSTSCNVTLRAEIGFKDDIKERVSNVRLMVSYPQHMAEFVEGSAMTGTKMVRASMEDGMVIIPVEKELIDDPVRLIMTAIDQGSLMTSAQVTFDLDGREVTQPIGVATCDVKYMTIVAPQKTHKLSFPVHGNAPALCPIRVYAGNDILVGETQSLADGCWDMHVELPDCPNLSTIPVYAVITTKQGREAKTETVSVTYDKNMIHPLHVLMFPPLMSNFKNPNDYSSVISDAQNLCIDFDFENPTSINEQWYSAYVHSSNPFFFEIIFNTTDSTLVKNVILKYTTVNGQTDHLEAEYDGTTGHWMCNVKLQNDAVCNVDVDYLDGTQPLIDADMLYLSTHMMDYIKEGFESERVEMDRILTGLETESNVEKRRQLTHELAEMMGIDIANLNKDDYPDRSLDEFFADVEKKMSEEKSTLDDFLQSLDPYAMDFGENTSYTHTDGLTPEQLLAEGYTAIHTTDGGTIYQLIDEEHHVIVDFQNDVRLETKVKAEAERVLAPAKAKGNDDFWAKVANTRNDINVLTATLLGLIEDAKSFGRAACEIFRRNWREYIKLEKEFIAKYGDDVAKLTEDQVKHLKYLQDGKNYQNLCAEISGSLGNTGLDIHPSAIPVYLTPKGIKLEKIMKRISLIGEVFLWVSVYNDCKDFLDRFNELVSILNEIPDPCKEDQDDADYLKKDISNFLYNPFASGLVPYYIALITSDVLSTETIGGGLKTAPWTGGTTLNASLGGVLITLTKMAASWVYDKTYEEKMKHYTGQLHLLDCDEEYRKKQKKYWRAYLKSYNNQFRNVRVGVDPSGFVYEAVADNRVENATATIYYKKTGEDEYGDLHDEAVKWDAGEFRQENPLLTDAEGKYAWDVPQGLWQVKIEKEGYETVYSDWLPVPPPQLDINIPLVRNTLPTVQAARAYEDGVEVTFNEYMRPQSLTTDRIMLSQNGQALTCAIDEQNRSKAYGCDDAYVSRIKVKPSAPLTNGSKVLLTVRRQVEAYNGLQMQKDFQQEFTVVREVYAIGTDSIVEVARGEERTITVHAFPAAAAQGMKLIAKSLIGTIATVTGEATFDANGEAHLVVTGKVGGQTALLLSLENSKVTAQSAILVEDPEMLPVYAPTASHISGTYLMAGEAVTLSCDTKDATIWYTTDSTCPCDENGTRKVYTAPITITQPTTIRAYAVKGENVSRVVTFTYNIYDPEGISDITPSDDQVKETWYTLGGLKLGAKPTQKGVYILNGNKVVVK